MPSSPDSKTAPLPQAPLTPGGFPFLALEEGDDLLLAYDEGLAGSRTSRLCAREAEGAFRSQPHTLTAGRADPVSQ